MLAVCFVEKVRASQIIHDTIYMSFHSRAELIEDANHPAAILGWLMRLILGQRCQGGRDLNPNGADYEPISISMTIATVLASPKR